MKEKTCPLCSLSTCEQRENGEYVKIICKTYGTSVYIDESIAKHQDREKLYNLICEKINYTPQSPSGHYWNFYCNIDDKVTDYDNFYNLQASLDNYPGSAVDVANRVLLNYATLYKEFGEEFYVRCDLRLCFPQSLMSEEPDGILKLLAQMGYIEKHYMYDSYFISAEGWKKVESLKKEFSEIKQCFIAMRFGEQTANIREGFRSAITNLGYTMCAIDEKEHNNQIVPEIFYEIERSKFVVVDVTYPNYGAYYEAGYAYGLGKEVIVCCSREAFENKDGKHERPHFDISQKSMVIWDDIEDLKIRLTRRIQATVR